jgi:hypothetical protein
MKGSSMGSSYSIKGFSVGNGFRSNERSRPKSEKSVCGSEDDMLK